MRADFLLAGVIRWLESSLALAVTGGTLVALAACGASGAADAKTPDKGRADGGSADAAAAGEGGTPKPFASSSLEATQLIGAALDSNTDVKKCVAEYRTRKNLPHERVSISVGIDQEGRLLGATLKGNKQDAPLSECVQRALADAPFPRSHAGVIQITKSYEEIER